MNMHTQPPAEPQDPSISRPVPETLTIGRRGFLGRAVVALVAAAAANVTAVIATRPEHRGPANWRTLAAEDPALTALGDRIEPALEAYRNAAVRRREARAIAESICPAVPEQIACEADEFGAESAVFRHEVDIEGKAILSRTDETGRIRYILDAEKTKAAISQRVIHLDRRTADGKKLVKFIAIAERYEGDRQAAIDQSGLLQARMDLFDAASELEILAYEAAEIEPSTAAGVLIQARVLSAFAEAEIDMGHHRGYAAQVVGLALARSLTRLGSHGLPVTIEGGADV